MQLQNLAAAAGYTDNRELIEAQVYYYRITGYFYDAEGNLVSGEVSDAAGVVASDQEPAKVENVKAVVENGQVVLTWDKAAGVRYYKVSRAAGATGKYATLKYNLSETTYTDYTVSSGTYRFKVVGYYKAVDNSWVYGDMSVTLFLTVK